MYNNLIVLDILNSDWTNWLSGLYWIYDYWVWLGLALFCLLAGIVGVANHRLPNRDDVTASYFISGHLGENNRLCQLLSHFQHDTAQLDPSLSPQAADLSGIYPIDDGEEALNIRLLLIRIAESSLDLQYYMWHDDASGRLLFHEVQQAAARGVRVRLLLDDNNTTGMDAVLYTLQQHPNIEVRLFNPFMNRRFRILGYLTAFKRLNRRMHNKSFTVDNQISVFGGRNIGDEYFGVNEKMNFADLDVVAIGKVVNDISTDFDRYWNCDASFPLDKIITRKHKRVDLTQLQHKEYADITELFRQQVDNSDFLEKFDQGLLTFNWVEVNFVSDPPTKALPDKLLQHNHISKYEDAAYLAKYKSIADLTEYDDNRNQILQQAQQHEPHLIDKISHTLLTPKRSLTIVSPYFVPSGDWSKRFVALAHKGIALNILTNSLTANDVLAVHAGYIHYRQALLQGGVNLFELKSKRRQLAPKAEAGKQSIIRLRKTHHRPSRHYRRQHRDRHRWLNRSTASLHAKTFSVDSEILFVGSFNFDPRSAAINTEMGALIKSPVLASQLDSMIDKWQQELSYVVSIHDDKLTWQDNSNDPVAVFTNEPDSSFMQRIIVWVLGKLPIEDFL